MNRLLVIAALLSPWCCSGVRAQPMRCPGTTTVEMRHCAEKAMNQSNAALQRRLPKSLLQQWQATTRAVCEQAYRAYKDGTIYPQLIVGCDDNLNRALLKELRPLEGPAANDRESR